MQKVPKDIKPGRDDCVRWVRQLSSRHPLRTEPSEDDLCISCGVCRLSSHDTLSSCVDLYHRVQLQRSSGRCNEGSLLAKQVANSLGLQLYEWNIKSTTKAQQGLYEYDAVSRLRDSQLGDKKVEEVKFQSAQI